MNQELKDKRKAERLAAKELARIDSERNQRPVKELTITIEWKKSRMWGANPHASASVRFHNGSYDSKDGYTASGCGYDKESTVIAAVFDDFLLYKLWSKVPDELTRAERDSQWKVEGKAPYGIRAGSYEGIDYRGYSGGIGTNCYYNISEYIGGKFERIASGKTFDVYRYTDI